MIEVSRPYSLNLGKATARKGVLCCSSPPNFCWASGSLKGAQLPLDKSKCVVEDY